MAEKNTEYYLKLPWSYRVSWSEPDKCYLGSIDELEENMTCGDTPEEAFSNLKEALGAYILTSLEDGFEIPEPLNLADFKGNITYRTNSEKHYRLAKKAARLGKSINALIDDAVEKELRDSA